MLSKKPEHLKLILKLVEDEHTRVTEEPNECILPRARKQFEADRNKKQLELQDIMCVVNVLMRTEDAKEILAIMEQLG